MSPFLHKKIVKLKNPHYKIGLVFLLFSVLWIIFSDEVVATMGEDVAHYKNLQLIKGLFFVSVTSLIIFFMIRKDHYIKEKQKERLKASEEKLQEHNEELQLLNEELSQNNEQIRKINHDLRTAKEKAEESDRLKTAFLNNISHEIRTPLNGILGFADLLQDPKLSEKEFDQYTAMLHKGSKRMLNTISDLVEIATLESGQHTLVKGNLDAHELMNSLAEIYASRAAERGISFKLEPFPVKKKALWMHTDVEKLESILNKLLDNAIKFTFKGGVHLGYEFHEKSIHFVVRDTGIGIPEDKQTLIFKRFIQADTSHTRPYEGSGLGLAIARAYCDLLFAKIEVMSKPSNGSTFILKMPFIAARPTAEKQMLISGSHKDISNSGRSHHIMIVEDDEASFVMLKIILSRQDYKITWAKSGDEALSLYKNNPDISLVLMDLKLPGIDGYEATRLLRSQNPDLPILAQSAFALSGEAQKAREAGCNDFIPKPVRKETLLQRVAGFLI